MSAPTFTPGPWEGEGRHRRWPKVPVAYIRDGKGREVACLYGSALGDAPTCIYQTNANAALIAAAPDLYEALRQLVGNAEIAKAHLPRTAEAEIVSSALFDTINQARVALTKASAIEARQGGDAASGSVEDESAVPKADAQPPESTQHNPTGSTP